MTSAQNKNEDRSSSLQDLAKGSRLFSTLSPADSWVRNSFLYRWLIGKSDSAVIVIDLRETYTFGLFIMLIDRAITRLAPLWRASRARRSCKLATEWAVMYPIRAIGVVLMAAAAMRVVMATINSNLAIRTLIVAIGLFVVGAIAKQSHYSTKDIQESHGYRVLIAALEPPDPPDESHLDTHEANKTDKFTIDKEYETTIASDDGFLTEDETE